MCRKIKKILSHVKREGVFSTIFWIYNCIAYKFYKGRVIVKDFEEIKHEKEELRFLQKKGHPHVFIVASIPYYDIGGGQRCSQLAKTYNKMGFCVEYLYAFKSSESKVFHLEMPMASHIFIDEKIIAKIENKVMPGDIFIFESPSEKFKSILELAIEKKCKIIYENIDNWETSLGASVYNEEMLKKLLMHSDILVGTAKPLVDQLKNYMIKYSIPEKPVLYLANAVDCELFCGIRTFEQPEDLVVGKKTFLYYGSLWGEWFDWDIIIGLAKRNKNYEFNLIGDYNNIQEIVEKCPDNVHFLGLKMQVELPAYLAHVDYSMIPFKVGEISDYVSPLKIFEYIAMYTKVLSTSLPDIQGYPNVYCGDTVEEWDEIIKKDVKVDVAAADAFVDDNSWFSRVSTMINCVYPEMNNSMFHNNLSIIILNYNNKNVIFRSLNALLKFNEIYNYEIIVVDNGSKDGSYELLEQTYGSRIKLVKNKVNGCSSGRNLGVSCATKDYILFLDSDQWPTNKYWLAPYESILKNDKNIGTIGWASGFFNKKGYAYHVVDSFPYRYMPADCLYREDISYLGSGGMLMLKKDFDAFGGFDLFYDPTCYEDTDISMKMLNYGKKIVYCPYIGIYHLPHQTTHSGSKEHLKLTNEKKAYFHEKWMKENPDLLSRHIK